MIYFIKIKNKDLIKIGKSKDPNSRLKQLQTSNPHELELMHVIETGGNELEKELHKKFKHLRKNGEWFEYTSEIKQEIEKKETHSNFISEEVYKDDKGFLKCPICKKTELFQHLVESTKENGFPEQGVSHVAHGHGETRTSQVCKSLEKEKENSTATIIFRCHNCNTCEIRLNITQNGCFKWENLVLMEDIERFRKEKEGILDKKHLLSTDYIVKFLDEYKGHLTIMKFSTEWKAFFGTPEMDFYERLGLMGSEGFYNFNCVSRNLLTNRPSIKELIKGGKEEKEEWLDNNGGQFEEDL